MLFFWIVGAALLPTKMPVPFESTEQFVTIADELTAMKIPPFVLFETVQESTVKLSERSAKIPYPPFCRNVEVEILGAEERGLTPFPELNLTVEFEMLILAAPVL